MLIKNMLVLAILLLGHQVAGACENIKSYKDILRCAEEKGPASLRAQALLEGAKAKGAAQSQWKNPEFAGQTIAGRVAGEDSRETDLALNFPIDLTRSAKRSAADAEVAFGQAEFTEAQGTLRAEVYLKLHRLRQLLHEKILIDESLMTFTKLTNSYQRRPLLSPEQQVSLALFRMAKSDYQLKLSQNAEDLQRLEASLSLLTQVSIAEIKKNLPPLMETWPSEFKGSGQRSAQLQKLDAEILSAQSELKLASQDSFSELTLGPSIKLLDEAGDKSQLIGFNLSFPLPLFNLNGAGKKSAASGLKAAEVQKELALQEEKSERQVLLSAYENSVQVLKDIMSSEELEKKHANVEQLFIKGMVPSSLVIEAHRSLVELERSRNERELATLDKLLKIHAIDGRLMEVEL